MACLKATKFIWPKIFRCSQQLLRIKLEVFLSCHHIISLLLSLFFALVIKAVTLTEEKKKPAGRRLKPSPPSEKENGKEEKKKTLEFRFYFDFDVVSKRASERHTY